MKDEYITVKFMTEKKVGHGEDAPPLLVQKERSCVVGVFDGMGGSGASYCNSEFGEEHTQAYVASRIVRNLLNDYFEKDLEDVNVNELLFEELIKRRFAEEKAKFPSTTKSILRSKLVREYPTTLAIIVLHDTGENYLIDSYWAGDSRCYIWTKEGLYQISKDDLDCDNDPMENLRNDAALSNCVCADRDFRINHKCIELPKSPIAILCATDGCFGYYPTPMHFEHILKRNLRISKSAEEWKEKIVGEIQRVTGDDTSLALIGYGFHSFDQFRQMMSNKRVEGVQRICEVESRMKKFQYELEKLKREHENSITNGWRLYKKQYMKYINEESHG